MNFKLYKKSGIFYLDNISNNVLNYVLKESFNCKNYEDILIGTLNPGEVKQFLPENKDGDYILEIDNVEINIKYYPILEKEMIYNFYKLICNCGCTNCDNNNILSCDFINTKNLIDLYKRLINPLGKAFFDKIYELTNCFIKKESYCNISDSIITGETKCDLDTFKQLIGLDYLALYYFEYNNASSTEDKEYVNKKYNKKDIFCCLENIGIDTNKINNIINNMATFKINSTQYVNQAPSEVGDYELSVNNRAQTVLTANMFTSDTTPAYTDPENDPADAIRVDSLPADGSLELNGNPVSVGDVISIADINNNLLVYLSPNQDIADTDTFNFSVRDTGSMQFTN